MSEILILNHIKLLSKSCDLFWPTLWGEGHGGISHTVYRVQTVHHQSINIRQFDPGLSHPTPQPSTIIQELPSPHSPPSISPCSRLRLSNGPAGCLLDNDAASGCGKASRQFIRMAGFAHLISVQPKFPALSRSIP